VNNADATCHLVIQYRQ